MQKGKEPMTKADIYCKIELIKDKSTGKMMFSAHLNKDAPNVTTDEQSVSWTPTIEEQHFIIDTISLLHKQDYTPLVTFTKKNKQSQPLNKDQQNTQETIESINQNIDNLPFAQNETNNAHQANNTIEEIIKQNKKQE